MKPAHRKSNRGGETVASDGLKKGSPVREKQGRYTFKYIKTKGSLKK